MLENKVFLTREGLERIKKEYESLCREREELINSGVPPTIKSEEVNPEFLSFKEKIDLIEERIEYLKNIIDNAEIIRKPIKSKRKFISLGSNVLVEYNGKVFNFKIVDTLESDPSNGKISIKSPVGKALLGHKAGDIVLVSSRPKRVYKIKRVEY